MREESLGNWARRASLHILLFIPLVAGCDTAREQPETPEVSATSSGAPKPLCSIEQTICGSVKTATATVDYAIFKGDNKTSKGLVLVEPGGPGFDLYARGDVNFMALPPALQSYDRLLLREPWTSQSFSATCAEALRALGNEMSKGAAALPRLDPTCALSGWTAASYREAVKAVLVDQKRDLAGIVGQSYGALPAAEAARDHPNAWLVLNAPIAPASMSGKDVIDGRQIAFQSALDRSYAKHCVELKMACTTKGAAVAADALNRFTVQSLNDRSEPLQVGDVELAIMSAAYDLESNGPWMWETLTAIPRVDANDGSTLARLSDQLIQRSGGGGTLSPRMAAYFTGICQSFSGWPETDFDPSMNLLLHAIMVQCVGSSGAAAWTTEPARRQAGECLYLNVQDPVARAADGAAWKKVFPQATVTNVALEAHISLERAVRQKATGAACRIDF